MSNYIKEENPKVEFITPHNTSMLIHTHLCKAIWVYILIHAKRTFYFLSNAWLLTLDIYNPLKAETTLICKFLGV